MNIYQKLIEVRKSVTYLQKENKSMQYNYVSSSQVLASLKSKMDELGLLLIPEITENKVTGDTVEYIDKYKKPKKTTTYFTELTIQYTWINADKPDEKIISTWYAQGVDIAGEKGVGKALTYAEKYYMLKFFNIPTDADDPDSFQKKIDETKQTDDKITLEQGKKLLAMIGQNKMIAKIIIKQKYKYTNLQDIKATDYDKIYNEIKRELATKERNTKKKVENIND